ncbi:MAG: Hsp20/alpha crystallin family protein [Gemmatimonadetes bacterium]|nr:Hsp20/alpha crystallin family protein [Gemmatimonadota bacterium]
MKLMKTSPSMAGVRNDFDRLFDRFFATPLWPLATPRVATDAMWEPSLDFSENPKEYLVRLEVPGMNRDDLDVNLDGNLLTLSGKRELHRQERGEDFLWEEREEGRFMRTLRLPGAVQEGKIDANYGDGVLTVKLPKAEASAKSKIAIK